MSLQRKRWLTTVAVSLGLVAAAFWLSDAGEYEVTLVMPSAAQLAQGSPVWIDGMEVGQVTDLDVRDGRAIVRATVADDYAPLHDGTSSRVEWKSALGERMLTLYPGPNENAEIPDGALIEADSRQVEVDQVLAVLDQPTRQRLAGLLARLHGTVDGNERDLRATIGAAGPALAALGQVLAAVGQDGPAIRSLVSELNDMTAALARRRADVAGTVDNLTTISGRVAAQQAGLTQSLRELPSTLEAARATLDRIPHATQATVPLLHDLRPSTERLRSVAGNLGPALHELTPALQDLTPLLADATRLLDDAPLMMTTAGDVLPPVGTAMTTYQPALSFLRPYTPEFVGWLANWGQNFAPYDSQGHVWSATLAPGTNAFNESLIRPPGASTSSKPYPGEIVGQPWTDANGSEMR